MTRSKSAAYKTDSNKENIVTGPEKLDEFAPKSELDSELGPVDVSDG